MSSLAEASLKVLCSASNHLDQQSWTKCSKVDILFYADDAVIHLLMSFYVAQQRLYLLQLAFQTKEKTGQTSPAPR